MKQLVITGATRSAVGGYLGSLKTVEAQDLGAAAIQAAAARGGISLEQVDEVIFGDVYGYTPNVARCAALMAGVPEETPAFTVDRQCASSLQAVQSACYEINAGEADIIIAGGVEIMSRMTYYLPPSSRYEPLRLGDKPLYDTFSHGVTIVQPQAKYPGTNMGITAENVAERYHITREEEDAFSVDSQNKTMESLGRLRPCFKDGGVVTAGNSSGMNDGASAVVIMTEEKAKELGVEPLVRIVGTSSAGVDPRYMGLGPVPAIRKLLKKTGLELADIDLFELNEAFAAQSLGCLKELGMDMGTELYSRVNVNGGAIAPGHALANSGTRILTTMIYELKRRNGRYGLASLCIGGGQGMAILVENCR